MLPAGSRLRRSSDFTATLRSAGASRGAGLLVVHLAIDPSDATTEPAATARIGFVVPRSVGTAVTRNRVRRRLRHLLRDRLDRLPGGARLVVRVLPAAAAASTAALGSALDRALTAALDRASAPAASS